MRSILRRVAKASRKSEITWRYASNFSATVGHRFDKPKQSEQAGQIVTALDRHGVAITSCSELFGDASMFEELVAAVDELEKSDAALLDDDRRHASDIGQVGGRKPYVRYLLGECPTLDLQSVFVRFALQQEILRITNAYFGMLTRLAYFNIWHTFTTTAAPQSSQLWHRDLDDPYYIMKVFVYLTDVGEGNGPLYYAAGSHSKGSMKYEPDYISKTTNSRRRNDQQMAEVIPSDRWIPAVGPRGTIVFADTHGYHKGGWAQTGERIVYTCMFTSPTVQLAWGHEQFDRPKDFRLPDNAEAAKVLMPRRPR